MRPPVRKPRSGRECSAQQFALVALQAEEDATEDEDGAVICHMGDSETLGMSPQDTQIE
jgi:hypothetical protein